MKKEKTITTSSITVAIFIVFIFLFSLFNLFNEKKSFSENENRYLANMPSTSLENIFLGDFDTEFENYFSDQFILRDKWIEIKSKFLRMSGAIDNNGVYFAKDGYLINQFINYDEKITNNNIDYINEFAEINDIDVNLLIVPSAAYGESDKLPLGAANINEKELINNIYSKTNNINCIDISEELANDDNYFHTDHHWNHKGANIAYNAICNDVLNKKPNTFTYDKVSNSFYGTMYSKSGAFSSLPDSIYKIISDDEITYEVILDEDKANDIFFENRLKEKDKYTYYVDGNHTYVNIKTNIDNNKKAIIIKDSFAHILIPYLASEYSEIEVFDLRYFHEAISPYIKDKDNTDVYIIYSLETFVSDSSLVSLW